MDHIARLIELQSQFCVNIYSRSREKYYRRFADKKDKCHKKGKINARRFGEHERRWKAGDGIPCWAGRQMGADRDGPDPAIDPIRDGPRNVRETVNDREIKIICRIILILQWTITLFSIIHLLKWMDQPHMTLLSDRNKLFLQKIGISAENRHFCRITLFLQKDRNCLILEK